MNRDDGCVGRSWREEMSVRVLEGRPSLTLKEWAEKEDACIDAGLDVAMFSTTSPIITVCSWQLIYIGMLGTLKTINGKKPREPGKSLAPSLPRLHNPC